MAVVKDGVEAIDTFSKGKFDLILLDIMLPKINGFTVCELIRKQWVDTAWVWNIKGIVDTSRTSNDTAKLIG